MPHDRAMKLSCEAAEYWGLADRSHTKTRYAYDARLRHCDVNQRPLVN